MRKWRWLVFTFALVLCGGAVFCGEAAAAVRIKDIVSVQGVRENQLVGYGLVIGIKGTGDTMRNSPYTEQSLQSLLDRMGINVRNQTLRARNVAAVMVTADFPAFGGAGSRIDVSVSSVGDATSLMGGTLLLTPLTGDLALDQCAVRDAPGRRHALGQHLTGALRREAGDSQRPLRHRIDLAVGAGQWRQQQRAAHQRGRVADRRHADVDARTSTAEGRKVRRHHHGRDVADPHVVRIDANPEAAQHAADGLRREEDQIGRAHV